MSTTSDGSATWPQSGDCVSKATPRDRGPAPSGPAGHHAAAAAPEDVVGVGRGADVDPADEPAPTGGLEVWTEESSGARSSTRSGSAPTSPAGPGPTNSAIEQLSADVQGDSAIVETFVSDYLGLLDHRLSAVEDLLAATDATDALRVRILSLETTSAMIGAGDVVHAAQALREAVARCETYRTRALYAQLETDVAALRITLGKQGFRYRPAV